MILYTSLIIAMSMIGISMLMCLYRLLIGPSVVDRLLALDTLFLNAICLIIVLSIFWATALMFEAALLISILGFVSTVALARYFTSAHVID